MQHGFSRCWDLLSSVTTRLLGGGRFPALCVMQAPALTMGASIVPPVWIILDNNDLDMNGGDSGVSRESGCWTWCVSPALFSSVANFSLGPDISSQHISNNLWWWNMLQWGSDGDLSQREGAGWHTGTSPLLQTSWYRVSPSDTAGPGSEQNTQKYFGFDVEEFLKYVWGRSETNCWWPQGSISISKIPTVQIIK